MNAENIRIEALRLAIEHHKQAGYDSPSDIVRTANEFEAYLLFGLKKQKVAA